MASHVTPLEALPREVVACQTDDGKEPFSEWMETLDPITQGIVIERIDRIERGLFGDCSSVGGGVSEVRIDHGPGYRIYFGQIGQVVHLISGGQKKRQQFDILAAKRFWNEHE
jgi:putative addiction module killer protein